MKNESAPAGAISMNTKSSGVGAGAKLINRKISGSGKFHFHHASVALEVLLKYCKQGFYFK